MADAGKDKPEVILGDNSYYTVERNGQLADIKIPTNFLDKFGKQSADFLIPKIISHARNAKAEIELGNLEVARDFSDVRTVVEAYARLLADPTAIGETFNVSSGQAVSLKSLIDMVARISGHSMKVRVNPAFLRANELRTLCGSPVKLHKSIGPLPHIPLEETLRWMLTAL